MKKWFLSCIAVLLSVCAVLPRTASAYSETPGTGRVMTEDVLFYADEALTRPVFTLTKTYYIAILDTDTAGDAYPVEYQSAQNGYIPVIGFVRKTDITLVTAAASPLFPVITAAAKVNTVLYEKADASSSKNYLILPDTPVAVYGILFNQTENKTYCFAAYGSKIGYLLVSDLDINLPDDHPDPMPTPPPPVTDPPPSDPAGTTEPTPDPVGGCAQSGSTPQIILILVICVPAVIIVIMLFRPGRRLKRNYRYYGDDEDDGE